MCLAKEASTKNSAIKLGIYSCVQAIVIDSLSVYIPHAQFKNYSNFPLSLQFKTKYSQIFSLKRTSNPFVFSVKINLFLKSAIIIFNTK